jgi:uncharacterized protein YndB with AHSA1/START domain
MTDLPFSLDRTIVIAARRATVFRFFTDPVRWARWWGEGSSIVPEVGGAVAIRYPDGSRASGTVRELVADERLVFTFGYERGTPIAPGGSLVTITLADHADGTRLTLQHDVADAAARDAHVQGWRYQLAVFARVASADEHAGAADAIARWFAAWSERDDAARRELLAAIATPELRFADPNGLTRGVDDLSGHIAGALRFMPGITLAPRSAPRIVHGTALVDWEMRDASGAARMTGTNVVRFAPDGRIAEVVGVPA